MKRKFNGIKSSKILQACPIKYRLLMLFQCHWTNLFHSPEHHDNSTFISIFSGHGVPSGLHEQCCWVDLPCKYPRFTRFITSLAVKLATSSIASGGKSKEETQERQDQARSSEQKRQQNFYKEKGQHAKNTFSTYY